MNFSIRKLNWLLGAGMIIVSGLLSSCSIFEGTSAKNSRNQIEGDRIAVLTFEQSLQADPQLANLQISLPKPYINQNWAQPGGNVQHVLQHLQNKR